MSEDRVRVGVVAFVERDGKILMEKRSKKEEEKDYWSFIAGGKKAGESVIQAAVREVKEETGAHFIPEKIVGIVDHSDQRGDKTSWTVVGIRGEVTGEVENMEPGKREILDWFDKGELPEPLHPTSRMMLDVYRNESLHSELH